MCRYEKIKNLNSTKMIFKRRNLSLVNFFCRYSQYLTKAYYYDEPYRKFSVVTKKVRIVTMKNCSFKTTSILALISSYLHGRVINSIKNISLLCCRREFDNLHGKKNWPLLANLSEVIFIEGQCWHLE